MSVLTYDENKIKQSLERLLHAQRIAFGAACSERLIGNYRAFKDETGWGDDVPLRHAIDRSWSFAMGETPSSSELKKMEETCLAVTPDSEDFTSLLTGPAQEAAFTICNVLAYLAENDIGKLVWSSYHPIAAVDLYIGITEHFIPNSPDFEEKIREHPLMQQEIKRQYDDLLFLEDGGSIEEFRKRSTEMTKSNLGL